MGDPVLYISEQIAVNPMKKKHKNVSCLFLRIFLLVAKPLKCTYDSHGQILITNPGGPFRLHRLIKEKKEWEEPSLPRAQIAVLFFFSKRRSQEHDSVCVLALEHVCESEWVSTRDSPSARATWKRRGRKKDYSANNLGLVLLLPNLSLINRATIERGVFQPFSVFSCPFYSSHFSLLFSSFLSFFFWDVTVTRRGSEQRRSCPIWD